MKTKQEAEYDEQKQIHNEQVRLSMKRKREAEKPAKKIKLHSETEDRGCIDKKLRYLA